jgi:hypothetical protein
LKGRRSIIKELPRRNVVKEGEETVLARGTERGGRGGGKGGYWREGAYEYKAGIYMGERSSKWRQGNFRRKERDGKDDIARQLVERAKEGKEQDRRESRRHKRQKCPAVCTPDF